MDFDGIVWPASRAAALMAALAPAGRERHGVAELLDPPGYQPLTAEWVQASALWHGYSAVPVESTCADIDGLVRRGAPSLLRLPGAAGGMVAVVGASRRRARVLCPDHSTRVVHADALAGALVHESAAGALQQIDADLAAAGLRGRRRERVRTALLRERLTRVPSRGHYLLRVDPGRRAQVRLEGGRARRAVAFLIMGHLATSLLTVLAFWIVGANALRGRSDRSWLVTWALLLFSLAMLRWIVAGHAAEIALRAGAWVKQRLFAGALRLEPHELRREGLGMLLGRIMEADAVEALALNGGLLCLLALFELPMGIGVLALGAAAALENVLLIALLAIAALATVRYLRLRGAWADARIDLSSLTLERMIGYRTRIVQEPPAKWHDAEDAGLERYLRAAGSMDRAWTQLVAMLPHVWLLLGLLALFPAMVARSPDAAHVAIAVGGILLAHRSLTRLGSGVAQLADADVGRRKVRPMLAAASRPEPPASPALWGDGATAAERTLSADNLVYRHAGRAEPTIAGINLIVRRGDHVLLEGPSGGGKSTLASLLAGLRTPDCGALLLGGLDRHTAGPRWWRRRVVCAPQFHENHVLTHSFLFNLLMGIQWPAPQPLIERAEVICRELGLGELIDKMPGGLAQVVGESGWQLSHGERSRLFIARALLQEPDVVVLDESLAALDPETFQRATRCIFTRARSLILIAHP